MTTDSYHYGKAMMTMAFGDSTSKYQEKVVNELKKRGYTGMYDNAMISAGTSNAPEAYESIIIFDPAKNLTDTGVSEKMTKGKVTQAQRNYYKWARPIRANRTRSGYNRESEQVKQGLSNRIKALKNSGLTYDEIADRLGFYSDSQVEYYLNYGKK